MAPRSRTRIVLALLLAALSFGALSATASAHRGGDDAGTTAGKRVALVGTVATVDPAARTLTVTVASKGKHRGWWRHHRLARAAHHGKRRSTSQTFTVNANDLTLPAVGDKVLVKGTLQQDGSVSATALRVLVAAADDDNDDDPSSDDDAANGDDDRGDCAGKGRGHHDDDDDDDRRGS